MTLDLLQVAPQIHDMAQEVGARQRVLAQRHTAALALMRDWTGRLVELRALARHEQPWLVAEPLEPLLARHMAPPALQELTMLATDGSSMDLDRHGVTQCYLLNVGAALIRYGAQPRAELTSRATLYYREDDLRPSDGAGRVSVQGTLLDLKRTLAEQQRALDLARAVREDGPLMVALDGTLLLWQLSGRGAEESYVAETIAAYAAGLEDFHRLGVPVCGYVSRPNGHEIVNLLRLAACPDGPAGCARCARGDCDRTLLAPLADRALMDHLAPGERSARFASRSPVLRHYAPSSAVQFTYLNVGAELARLEVPAWVGDDPALLDLVHAAVYDSCARGWGYPPALAEAHEQAVIRGADRAAFLQIVMEALNSADAPAVWSGKQLSKNRRAV